MRVKPGSSSTIRIRFFSTMPVVSFPWPIVNSQLKTKNHEIASAANPQPNPIEPKAQGERSNLPQSHEERRDSAIYLCALRGSAVHSPCPKFPLRTKI